MNDGGYTSLIFACCHNRIEVIKFLIEKGADANIKNEDGQTALMFASRCNHIEVVKFLVEIGVDVNAEDNEGYTALMHASEGDDDSEVKKFLTPLTEQKQRIEVDVATMYDGFMDDLCPECLLEEVESTLYLNKSDFFECPKCNLQISFREYSVATVLNFRGKGQIREKKKSISSELFGAGLAPMDANSKYLLSVGLFKDEKEFKDYISKISRG